MVSRTNYVIVTGKLGHNLQRAQYRPDRDDSSSTPKFTIRTVQYLLRCTNHNH